MGAQLQGAARSSRVHVRHMEGASTADVGDITAAGHGLSKSVTLAACVWGPGQQADVRRLAGLETAVDHRPSTTLEEDLEGLPEGVEGARRGSTPSSPQSLLMGFNQGGDEQIGNMVLSFSPM